MGERWGRGYTTDDGGHEGGVMGKDMDSVNEGQVGRGRGSKLTTQGRQEGNVSTMDHAGQVRRVVAAQQTMEGRREGPTHGQQRAGEGDRSRSTNLIMQGKCDGQWKHNAPWRAGGRG